MSKVLSLLLLDLMCQCRNGLQVSGEGKESGQEGLVGMSGSSLGSLYSILSSILSSSSTTGNLATAHFLPPDNSSPIAPSHLDETPAFVMNSSKIPHSSSPPQSSGQNKAKAAGQVQNTQQEPLLGTAKRNYSKRQRGKRPLSGHDGAVHASDVGEAMRLLSTPSSEGVPDPSAVGGRPNEEHTREDDRSMEDAVDDCESSDSDVPAKKRRLAKSKGRTRVRQAEEASAEPPHHVPKSKYKGVSCHKCACNVRH